MKHRARTNSRRLAVILLGAMPALLASTAHATGTHGTKPLKAIYGPLTMPDGSSGFPVYHRLGVNVLERQLSWSTVASSRPNNPTDPTDPAYRWPADLDGAMREAAR